MQSLETYTMSTHLSAFGREWHKEVVGAFSSLMNELSEAVEKESGDPVPHTLSVRLTASNAAVRPHLLTVSVKAVVA